MSSHAAEVESSCIASVVFSWFLARSTSQSDSLCAIRTISFNAVYKKSSTSLCSATPYTPNSPVLEYVVLNAMQEWATSSRASSLHNDEETFLPALDVRSHEPRRDCITMKVTESGWHHPTVSKAKAKCASDIVGSSKRASDPVNECSRTRESSDAWVVGSPAKALVD